MLRAEHEAIDRFLRSLRPNTQRSYRSTLNDWTGFFPKSFTRIKAKHVMDFLDSLRSRIAPDGLPLADETIRLKANAMRSMASFLVDVGLIRSNPFSIIRRVVSFRQHAQKRPTKLIPFHKVAELLEAPAANTKDGIRDRALLAILFGGGLRRSEARGLKLADVMTDPNGVPFLMLPRTKAGKTQRQPLPPWAWEAFSRLVSQRKRDGADESYFVFPFYYANGDARGQLAEKSIYRLYRDYCAVCGIIAAPHSARATAATMLASEGWPETKIAEFLRHSSTAQVGVYIKLAKELSENAALKLEFPGVMKKAS